MRHGAGDPPLWLELDDPPDHPHLRRALGIGHAGFGEMSWPPRRGFFHGKASALDAVAGVVWAATFAAVCAGRTEIAITIAVLLVPLTMVAVAHAAARAARHPLSLASRGLEAVASGKQLHVGWAAVIGAEAEGAGLVVHTLHELHRLLLPDASPDERGHWAAQIRSAASRGRGEGPPPPDVPPSAVLLAPRDEDGRAWIERIDATAASLVEERGGYRAAGVRPEELWETLESPAAPPPLRAAAARILARVAPDDAGERIGQVLSREHDARARDAIVAALEEDVDAAARALEPARPAR